MQDAETLIAAIHRDCGEAQGTYNAMLLTHSVKMSKLTLGSGKIIQGVDPIDLISTWVQGQLVQTDAGTSFWHALVTLNIAQLAWATFRDTTTGKSLTVYSGEITTVFDPSGWSVKAVQPWRRRGTLAGCAWFSARRQWKSSDYVE